MGAADRLQQQAVVVARHDGGARIAAFGHALRGIQPQSAHAAIGVAGVAVLRQHRPHFGLEELALVRAANARHRQCSQPENRNAFHPALRLVQIVAFSGGE